MKSLLLLMTATFILADSTPKKGFERIIDRYEYTACDKVKALVEERYDVVEMDAGCRCERTDSREWQCDIRFTYTEKKQAD